MSDASRFFPTDWIFETREGAVFVKIVFDGRTFAFGIEAKQAFAAAGHMAASARKALGDQARMQFRDVNLEWGFGRERLSDANLDWLVEQLQDSSLDGDVGPDGAGVMLAAIAELRELRRFVFSSDPPVVVPKAGPDDR